MRWGKDIDGSRLVGVDLARGLAILGMLWVHFAPDGTGTAWPDGRSAILFATLAGVSLGLLTGGAHPPARGQRLASYRTVAVRGVVLVVLGRLLVLLRTPIAVILDYYGVLFLLLLLVLFARRWVLALVVALALALGAWLIQRAGANPSAAFGSENVLAWPGQWFLTGLYPVALYAAYVGAGLFAARSDLSRRRTQLVMLVGGVAVAPVGYLVGDALGVDSGPHANTTWEAIGSGSVALAVIGLLLLLSSLRVVRAVFSPLADIGAMPLTIYTGQILAAAFFLSGQPEGRKSDIAYWWLLAVIVAGSLSFAVVWRRLVGRGPLEQVLATVSRAGRSVSGGSAADDGARVSGTAPRARAARAVGVALVSGAVGAAVVWGLSLVISAPPLPGTSGTSGARTITAAGGSVRVQLDADLLRKDSLTPGAAGAARVSGTSVELPITAGQVSVATDATGGGIVLGGGFSLTSASQEVRFSDLLIDLEAGTAAGDLSVGGASLGQDSLLFRVSPEAPGPASDTADTVTVAGLGITITRATASLINARLGSTMFDANATIGTADLTITGS